MNIITFHNPDEDNGYLSNWYLSDFVYDNITFSSLEQYMMYYKAMTFQDTHTAKKILDTNDVAVIKQLGREVTPYNDHVWNGVRQVIVYEGLYAKFSQNKELKELLLNTHEDILAEAAKRDKIWGIGLTMDDPKRLDMTEWKGQNLLGYALMLVRKRLELK